MELLSERVSSKGEKRSSIYGSSSDVPEMDRKKIWLTLDAVIVVFMSMLNGKLGDR